MMMLFDVEHCIDAFICLIYNIEQKPLAGSGSNGVQGDNLLGEGSKESESTARRPTCVYIKTNFIILRQTRHDCKANSSALTQQILRTSSLLMRYVSYMK